MAVSAKDINVSRILFCKLGTSFTEVRRYGDINDSLEYGINVSQLPLLKLYTAFIKSENGCNFCMTNTKISFVDLYYVRPKAFTFTVSQNTITPRPCQPNLNLIITTMLN